MKRRALLALVVMVGFASERLHAQNEATGAAFPPESVDVAIIGAGLAGVVTAYELRKRGFSTLVLELQP